ncbi:MAG: translation initiation factor IF-2 [Patescibacteria group bacterium]|nr:translation initiation factor IF-2 [Patescibacteria group bacterium]
MEKKTEEKIKIPSVVSVKEFCEKIDKPVAEVIKVLLDNGFLATINETIDFETAALIAQEFDVMVREEKIDEKKMDVISPEQLAEILKQEKDKGKNLRKRPVVVTILGHVDHGKTTLLDTIRKTKVAESESGGITQHITSYQVKAKGRLITFVDTPGHEAFSKMRARGAGLADIAILIVAADDGVKPQTKEVIKNFKKGKVPMIVAINKIDKPGANAEKVKGQLAEAGILLEKRGGEIPCVEISAKNNIGIDELLETILLLADVLKIEADWERKALGIVLESHLDQRRGVITTAIIKTGALEEGDSVIAGDALGSVRQLLDYSGKRVMTVGPGSSTTIVGFSKICKAGAVLQVEESRTIAKEKTRRLKLDIMAGETGENKATAKKINESIKTSGLARLNLILRADAGGSLEALKQILDSLPGDQVTLDILSQKVGNVTETDVQLAETSKALVYGFKVAVPDMVNQASKKAKVEIRNFEVIYKLVDDIKEEMSKLLEPEIVRTDLGELEVLAIFRTEKDKMIVGGKVKKGRVKKGASFEIWRGEEKLGQGQAKKLKQGQAETDEAEQGLECGITYIPKKNLIKIQEGDVLKFYEEQEIERKIE